MLKEAKRKARLAQRRAKRLSSSESDSTTKEEIKSAYNKLAKQFHPDKNNLDNYEDNSYSI